MLIVAKSKTYMEHLLAVTGENARPSFVHFLHHIRDISNVSAIVYGNFDSKVCQIASGCEKRRDLAKFYKQFR